MGIVGKENIIVIGDEKSWKIGNLPSLAGNDLILNQCIYLTIPLNLLS